MSRSVAPPSPQEVHRKLSIHTKAKVRARSLNVITITNSDQHWQSPVSPVAPVSGTESDSDSAPPDILSNVAPLSSGGASGSLISGTPAKPPLTSIAERRSGSGDESEEDEDEEEEGGWKTADVRGKPRGSADETVIKAGYLWKKGERRKVRRFND